MKSFLFLFRFRFLKTNRYSFGFYETKTNYFRYYFRFRNENRSGRDINVLQLIFQSVLAPKAASRTATAGSKLDIRYGEGEAIISGRLYDRDGWTCKPFDCCFWW